MVFQFGVRVSLFMALFLGGVPSRILAQKINSTLINGKYTCQGSEVIFTCVTRGSPGITWTSEEFIGPGGAEISFSAEVDDPKVMYHSRSVQSTVATLTKEDNDNGVLESTLRIIATASSLSPSVTCKDENTGMTATTNFQLLAEPDVPEIVVAVQLPLSKSDCEVHMIWRSNVDSDKRSLTRYIVKANEIPMSPDLAYINDDTWISSLFKVPNCGPQNISVSANNNCGMSGMSNASVLIRDNVDVNVSTTESERCITTTDPIDASTLPAMHTMSCSVAAPVAIPLVILAVACAIFVSTVVLLVWYVYKLKKQKPEGPMVKGKVLTDIKTEAMNPLSTNNNMESEKSEV